MPRNPSIQTWLKDLPQQSLVFLDIDSTLVTTHQRNQAIILEFCKQMASKWPQDCQSLSQLQCQQGDYGYFSALERLNFKPNAEAFLESLAQYWRQEFFSNYHLHNDQAYSGAVEFVHDLKNQGHEILYLTGRHKQTMWEGTLETLNKLGFPITEDILILKPEIEQKDEIYKSEAVAEHKQKPSSAVWLIDNEPLILHQMMEDHPEVELIFFKSCHSRKKPEPTHLLTIDHF